MTNEKRHIATFTKAEITKLGGHTYQNKTVPFLHVITWQIKNFVVQFSRRLLPPDFVGIHVRMREYYSFMSLELVTLK